MPSRDCRRAQIGCQGEGGESNLEEGEKETEDVEEEENRRRSSSTTKTTTGKAASSTVQLHLMTKTTLLRKLVIFYRII